MEKQKGIDLKMKSDSTLRLVYYSTISDIFQPYLYFPNIYFIIFLHEGLKKRGKNAIIKKNVRMFTENMRYGRIITEKRAE